MLQNKIILIGILLMSVSSVCAWDSEAGLTEDELFDIQFNSAYMYMDDSNPKWYDPTAQLNDFLVTFEGYFTHTPPTIEARVQIKKMIWTGSYYIEDTDFIDLDTSTYFELKANATETYPLPCFKHLKKVFNDNPNEFDDFKTVDEDKNHPDILNISVNIDADGETLDFESYGYITFTDAALTELESQTEGTDYGFISTGRGSDSGSGGIYEGLNVYGSGTGDGGAGMGNAFSMLFYAVIPLLFIICVCKFVFKVI